MAQVFYRPHALPVIQSSVVIISVKVLKE